MDLDGTLTDVRAARRWVDGNHLYWRDHRDEYEANLTATGRFRPDHERFDAEAVRAPLRADTLRFVRTLRRTGCHLAVVSLRVQVWREETIASLHRQGLEPDWVRLRFNGDGRAEVPVKRGMLSALRREHNASPVGAIDDEPAAALLCAADVGTLLVRRSPVGPGIRAPRVRCQ